MSGWSNDGRAKPTWRSCNHLETLNNRCTGCNAKSVEYVAPKRTAWRATTIGNFAGLPQRAFEGLHDNHGSYTPQQWNNQTKKVA